MRELVQENVTGIFAPVNDPAKLAEKMLWMMEHYNNFDLQKIADSAREYDFKIIAEQFDLLYKNTIA